VNTVNTSHTVTPMERVQGLVGSVIRVRKANDALERYAVAVRAPAAAKAVRDVGRMAQTAHATAERPKSTGMTTHHPLVTMGVGSNPMKTANMVLPKAIAAMKALSTP
jgi:hypothetical protein